MFYSDVKLALLAAGAVSIAHRRRTDLHADRAPRYRLQRRASSNMNALLHDNLDLASGRSKVFVARTRRAHAFNRVSDQLRHATLSGDARI